MSASVSLNSTIGAGCPECTDTTNRRLVCMYHMGWADAVDAELPEADDGFDSIAGLALTAVELAHQERHGAGDAGLTELIAANVVGELENIADDLQLIYADVRFQRPESGALVQSCSQRARKIAAGIRTAMDGADTVEVEIQVDLTAFDREISRATASAKAMHTVRGEGASTGDGEDGVPHPTSTPSPPHPEADQ